jgi:hypothetical protein
MSKEYIVTKRPGQNCIVTEQDGPIKYEQLKKSLDNCTFTMTQISVELDGKCHWVDVYCDDEGLLNGAEFCFFHMQYDQPIMGPVLCCLGDEEGESVPMSKELANATSAVLTEWASVVPVMLG